MTDTGCLRVGQQAPDFTATAVVDQEFTVTLSQYRQVRVLFFIRWISPCLPDEITAFSDRYADFSSKNTMLGVSVDSQFSHLLIHRNQGGLGDINYPLADRKKEIPRLQRPR